MVVIYTLLLALAHANPVERLAPDFTFVRTSVELPKRSFTLKQDCRTQIAGKICVTEPSDLNSVDMGNRDCVGDGSKYAAVFEKLYDRFPAYLAKMFCFVEKIYIEPESPSVAYATMAQDPSGNTAAFVGVGQIYLDSNASLDTIMSWKEQINFGGAHDGLNFSAALPVAQSSLGGDFVDTLYYVLAHEFGHVFDFANGFNKQWGGGPWYDLSWSESSPSYSIDQFGLRNSLCFYDCSSGYLRADQQDDLYKQLEPTDFTSAYSTVNSFEDFAETFALYTVKTQRQNPSFEFKTADGATYDLMKKMDSPQLANKVQFIKNFLSGTVKYPGQN